MREILYRWDMTTSGWSVWYLVHVHPGHPGGVTLSVRSKANIGTNTHCNSPHTNGWNTAKPLHKTLCTESCFSEMYSLWLWKIYLRRKLPYLRNSYFHAVFDGRRENFTVIIICLVFRNISLVNVLLVYCSFASFFCLSICLSVCPLCKYFFSWLAARKGPL